MPESLIYIIPVATTTTPVGPRGGGSSNNGGVLMPVPIVSTIPIQVAGLVPMVRCDVDECRSLPNFCCDRLEAFGNTTISGIPISSSTYENDLNDWLFDCQLVGTVGTWTIEKCSGKNRWSVAATITNNQYGRFQAIGTISGHTTYTGFTVNWGRVLVGLGIGIYRIKFSSNYQEKITCCFVSPEFRLRKFNCVLATRTVKFEVVMPDLIGTHTNTGYLFDFCGMNWASSVRVGGFFGSNTVPTYTEMFNKFQTGQIEHVHAEATQKWKFDSLLLTKEIHDRLKVYMMLAKQTLVSDYNVLNVDYTIKQLPIARAGAYEPTDYNNALPPKSSVTVEFNAGIQNIIASNCCNLK
jgi:hypothetical protein